MRLRRHSFLQFKEKINNQEISSNQRNFSLIVSKCTNLFDSKTFFLEPKKLFSGYMYQNTEGFSLQECSDEELPTFVPNED